MTYSPPPGANALMDFGGAGYRAPGAGDVNLELDPDSAHAGARTAGGFLAGSTGTPGVRFRFSRVAGAGGVLSERLGVPHFSTNTPKIQPEGIPSSAAAGTPEKVSWRKFAAPVGIEALSSFISVEGIELLGGYRPPHASSVALDWGRSSYLPPGALNVPLEFAPASGEGVVGGAGAGDQSLFGQGVVSQPVQIRPQPASPGESWGAAFVDLKTKYLRPGGAVTPGAGAPRVANSAYGIAANGSDAAIFGNALVFNLRQYVWPSPLLPKSAPTEPFVKGGSRRLSLGGIDAWGFTAPTVFNPRADQTIRSAGVVAPTVPAPSVSPCILYPGSIYGTGFSYPLVQFPPRPAGWDSLVFGALRVRDKAFYLRPMGVPEAQPSYPRVADRASRVLHTASPVTTVFGDVIARLLNARVAPGGIGSLEFSPWAELRNINRAIFVQGAAAPDTSPPSLWQTPSIAPAGVDACVFGEAGIGWRVRQVYAVGAKPPDAAVPRPSLWQTPALRPLGIQSPPLPLHSVQNGKRFLFVDGASTAALGKPTTGFRLRSVTPVGVESLLLGAVRAEHSDRGVRLDGFGTDAYGTPLLTFRVRRIEPSGIKPVEGGMRPMVGGTRWLRPDGYTATRWGTRIIPEAVAVFPLGFSGAFGWPTAKNVLQRVAPDSIRLYKEPQQHFGTSAVFSSRQFVSMEYDPDSGLNQPYWPRWTLVENRNRRTGASGWVASTLGTPHINNGARALLPVGASAPSMPSWYQAGLVAYRIRPLRLGGVEPPYVTGWLRIHNAARVVQPSGVFAQAFGIPAAENRSRALDRVGGGDFAWLGYPFVAPRIREITFEGRYTVGAPRVALPTVHLHQRYIDAAGVACPEVGRTSLETHWNRITPRWTMVNRYGYPAVKNLTPELLTRGSMTDEWGSALVRLEWRPVKPEGHCTELFGRVAIADTRRAVFVSGTNALRIGDKLKVEKTGAPPMALQYIWLNSTDPISMPDAGHGIPTPGFPDVQVGKPSLQQQVLYPRGIAPEDLQLVGSPTVTANSIRVEPGIFELTVGEPGVSLRVRRVTAPSVNTGLTGWGEPRITPHTIYAPLGAPKQAVDNHPTSGILHPIDSIHRFGATNVENRHRVLTHIHGHFTNGGDSLRVGRAAVHNSRQYVAANSFATMRFGWHAIPGDGELVVSGIPTAMAVGRPLISRPPYVGPQTVLPKSVAPVLVPITAAVEHFNRTVTAVGFAAGRLGGPKDKDKPFQWQGLRVGPLVPNIPDGFQSDIHGSTWVSLRVRQVDVEGYDAFLCEYDYTAFEQRMRVRNSLSSEPATQRITTQGIDSSVCGWTQVRPMRHYIRPDGNSDQHRKGVIQ